MTLTEAQTDAVTELVNIAFARTAGSSCERSRSGPIAPQTVKPTPASSPAERRRSTLNASGSSTATSTTSNPSARARATSGRSLSLNGDVQIHVDAPIWFIPLSSEADFERETTD